LRRWLIPERGRKPRFGVSGSPIYHIKELLETFDRAIFPNPQQLGTTVLNLIDQSEIFVTLGILDLIDADRVDLPQIAVRQSPLYDILYRVKYLIPRCSERNRSFLP
jgi:hypothetical protein